MKREWPTGRDWFNLAVGILIGLDLGLLTWAVTR